MKAPRGQEFYLCEPGKWALRPVAADYEPNMTIAFRVPQEVYVRLMSLTETFEKRTWAEAMRWLVEQPEVVELVKARVRSASRQRQKAVG